MIGQNVEDYWSYVCGKGTIMMFILHCCGTTDVYVS